MAKWKMFLDDERNTRDPDFTVCRSVREAKNMIDKQGCPWFISFDHDLGLYDGTGYDFAKWLVEQELDARERNEKFFPEGFFWYVHSQNPVGARNIHLLMYNFFYGRNSTVK